MSDASQGPGWWQASDGKWYPPEQQPGYQQPGYQQPAPAGGPMPGPGGAATKVDVGTALSYGFNKFGKYFGQIILILVVLLVVNLAGNFIGRVVDSIFLALILQIGFWIVSLIIQLGIVRLALDVTAGREPEVSTLFKTDRLAPYIIASILYGLAVMVGLLALCIGAVIVAFFLYFYPFFILDRNEEPVASLQSSFNLVKDHIGELALLAIACIVITAISCGVLSPVAWIAAAYAYKNLTGQPVAP
jgi:hypothetical protein